MFDIPFKTGDAQRDAQIMYETLEMWAPELRRLLGRVRDLSNDIDRINTAITETTE